MRFVMAINEQTQDFLAAINGGIVPEIKKEKTFFVIGDDQTPYEIVTKKELKRFGKTNQYRILTVDIFDY